MTYGQNIFAIPSIDFDWLAGLAEHTAHRDDEGERSVYRDHDTDTEEFIAFSEFDGFEFMFYATVTGYDRLHATTR